MVSLPKHDRPFIIYAYRLTSDSGSAPCIHDLSGKSTGILTLACCKGGRIRKEGEVERGLRYSIGKKYMDAIDNNEADVYLMGIYKNTLLYFANITKIVTMNEYYAPDSQYKNRMDSIYDYIHDELKRNNNNPHFHPKNNIKDPDRHTKDRLGKYVLISTRFAYWGKESMKLPDDLLNILPKFQENKSYSENSPEGEQIMSAIEKLWDFKSLVEKKPHSPDKSCQRTGCVTK